MIHVTNIRNMHPEQHDHAYVIVRSLKQPIKHTIQLPVLSPDKEIFWQFLNLQKQGKWNQETFDHWYTPAFLAQITNDENARDILRDILYLDKQGKDIVLACFCNNPNLCHRSIIAGILAENGGNVKTDNILKHYGLLL